MKLPSIALAFALASGAVVACGPGVEAKTAHVTPGEMPANETWTGVYYHPIYGHLHLVEQGSNVVGRWKRTDQSQWGEMSGTKQGNLFRFTWKEHRIGMVGPGAESHGKGYFQYKNGQNNIPELDGQFGLNEDETGSDWHNVKQQRMNPDLKSINGDTGAAPPAGQKWD